MDERNRRELMLDGLDCAVCAAKVEKKINGLPGVTQAEHKEYEEHKEYKQHEENEGINITRVIRLGIGAVLFFTALLFKLPFEAELGIFLASYILVGGEVILKAIKNMLKGRVFDENFLMSAAAIGAFAIREFPEGVSVLLFYQVGEFFQEIAVNRSRKSIAALMDISPDYANLKAGDKVRKVSPYEVSVGDIIIIKPGEKVPLDGKVIDGRSMLDTSALTGESAPREVEPGSDILSGSINKNGLLAAEVTKEFSESTVSRILDLVQKASSKKAPTENFITKFAMYYTPVVVFTALALSVIPPLVIHGATFAEWIKRALVFLVVSCPCALVISIPLGFFGGIGGASRNGILVKGSNYLEALNNVDTIVFDKTGTLTRGVFKVTKVKSLDNIADANLLEYAAYAESYSNHPIALSIVKAFGGKIDKNEISDYSEIPGHGIKATVKGKKVLAGNSKLMIKENIFPGDYEKYEDIKNIKDIDDIKDIKNIDDIDETGTVVHIAIEGKYAGHIVISDELKDDSKNAIQMLRNMGVKKLVMFTGDSKPAGEKIGKDLGLDEVYAGLLPHQKVEKLEILYKQKPSKRRLVFVGDGINDAPVLARADIGIAMGGIGSDAAIEAADIVLMTDEPSKIAAAIKIARRTRRIVWQNIIFALAIKGIVLLLGASGIAAMWEAVFADVGVALLAVLNAMRAIKVD